MAHGHGYSPRQRTARHAQRQAAPHRRLRYHTPAPGNSQRICVFISLEDETGVANAIITPDLFQSNRLLLASEKFLAIEGILQNQDNVISVKAERVQPLFVTKAETVSHDFH
jgi:DNA polymerase III alpha subunit